MKRQILQNILLNFYTTAMSNMILRGDRKPKYKVMVELDEKHNIPFNVWIDIKSYIENDTKDSGAESNTKSTKKV